MVLKKWPHVFMTGIGWALHMLTATVSAQTGSMPNQFLSRLDAACFSEPLNSYNLFHAIKQDIVLK